MTTMGNSFRDVLCWRMGDEGAVGVGGSAEHHAGFPNVHGAGHKGGVHRPRQILREHYRRQFSGSEKGENTLMPWIGLSGMSESDLGAIYDYMKTVKPIRHNVNPFPEAQTMKSAGMVQSQPHWKVMRSRML